MLVVALHTEDSKDEKDNKEPASPEAKVPLDPKEAEKEARLDKAEREYMDEKLTREVEKALDELAEEETEEQEEKTSAFMGKRLYSPHITRGDMFAERRERKQPMKKNAIALDAIDKECKLKMQDLQTRFKQEEKAIEDEYKKMQATISAPLQQFDQRYFAPVCHCVSAVVI